MYGQDGSPHGNYPPVQGGSPHGNYPPVDDPANRGSQELKGVGGSTDPVMGKWHSYLAWPA